jgi:hypothetical protein
MSKSQDKQGRLERIDCGTDHYTRWWVGMAWGLGAVVLLIAAVLVMSWLGVHTQ